MLIHSKLFTLALPCLSHWNPKKGSGLNFSLAPIFCHPIKMWWFTMVPSSFGWPLSIEPASIITFLSKASFLFSSGHDDFTIPYHIQHVHFRTNRYFILLNAFSTLMNMVNFWILNQFYIPEKKNHPLGHGIKSFLYIAEF